MRLVEFGLLLACIAFTTSCVTEPPEPPLDLLIANGLVFSGAEGDNGAVLDVGVRNGRIAFVGKATGARGTSALRTIDATGLYVSPGFIDPHTHADEDLGSDGPEIRAVPNHTTQGVTTVFIGVDGFGPPDLLTRMRAGVSRGVGVNVAAFAGFGGIRRTVVGDSARAPTPDELERMKALVAGAMCDGALGFSAGLYYAPQSYATTVEVVALARESAVRGGVYDTHMRDESSDNVGLVAAVQEVLRIGREIKGPVHIAHIKAQGVDVHGKSVEVIALINAARAAGQDVTADQYTWGASGTRVGNAFIPRWAMDGGALALRERLGDLRQVEVMRPQIADNIRRRTGAQNALLTSGPHAGKSLAEVAQQWGVDPVEAVIRIVRDENDAAIVSFNMIEGDIFAFARQPWVVASSDASAGHPRKYGSFPYRWRRLVQEEKILTAGEFIRRSTGLTADIYGLPERGYLRAGYRADIVVFDPAGLRERADYVRPTELSVGVRYLTVNGTLAVDGARVTGALSGEAVVKARQTAWACPPSH